MLDITLNRISEARRAGVALQARRHGCLFVLLARRVSDRAPLFSRGVRHVRQILNPLRDIRHALNLREVQGY